MILFYYKGTVLSMDQLLTVQSFVGAFHPMFESSGILAFCYKGDQEMDLMILTAEAHKQARAVGARVCLLSVAFHQPSVSIVSSSLISISFTGRM